MTDRTEFYNQVRRAAADCIVDLMSLIEELRDGEAWDDDADRRMENAAMCRELVDPGKEVEPFASLFITTPSEENDDENRTP